MKVIVVASLLIAVASASVLPLFSQSNPKENFVEIEPFILGGQAAQPTNAPYLLSISISSLQYAHFCAGTIIDKEWFLTAAHCALNISDGTLVYAGLSDRNQLENAQVRRVDFIFSHKEFTGQPGSVDIALAHVSQPFEFNARVKRVILPNINEEYEGETKSYGWGLQQNEDNMYSTELMMSKGEVMSAAECKSLLPADAPVSRNNVCAALTACYGDGGSPLVKEYPDGITELVGITSWAYIPCGYKQRPTIYTIVSNQILWIHEVQMAYYILN